MSESNLYERIIFENIDFSNPGIFNIPPLKSRRSPLMVTLVDTAIKVLDLQNMLNAGVTIYKLHNHHTKSEKLLLLSKLRRAVKLFETKHGLEQWPAGICVELKICVVKTGLLEDRKDVVFLSEGSEIILNSNFSEFDKCNESNIFVDNPNICVDVDIGMEISISQDEIILICTEKIDEKSLRCKVVKEGSLMNMCQVCVRGAKNYQQCFTKKDASYLRFSLENEVDMLIINYVRQADIVRKAKQMLGEKNKRPIIISGICCERGLSNLDEILEESDALLLARDILPYEMDRSKGFRMLQIQKFLAAKCLQAGKPFFLSGGIYAGYLLNKKVCSHDVSDVTNALIEGVTGFVLNECYDPDSTIRSIKHLNQLCCKIEPLTNNSKFFWDLTQQIKTPVNAAEAAAISCASVAQLLHAKMIVIPTGTGRTASLLLSLRPLNLVITVSTNIRVVKLLKTYRGVVPLFYNRGVHGSVDVIEDRVKFAVEFAVKMGYVTYGDVYLTLQKSYNDFSYCDMIRIWHVNIGLKSVIECDLSAKSDAAN